MRSTGYGPHPNQLPQGHSRASLGEQPKRVHPLRMLSCARRWRRLPAQGLRFPHNALTAECPVTVPYTVAVHQLVDYRTMSQAARPVAINSASIRADSRQKLRRPVVPLHLHSSLTEMTCTCNHGHLRLLVLLAWAHHEQQRATPLPLKAAANAALSSTDGDTHTTPLTRLQPA
jgi:hypothetical protein